MRASPYHGKQEAAAGSMTPPRAPRGDQPAPRPARARQVVHLKDTKRHGAVGSINTATPPKTPSPRMRLRDLKHGNGSAAPANDTCAAGSRSDESDDHACGSSRSELPEPITPFTSADSEHPSHKLSKVNGYSCPRMYKSMDEKQTRTRIAPNGPPRDVNCTPPRCEPRMPCDDCGLLQVQSAPTLRDTSDRTALLVPR